MASINPSEPSKRNSIAIGIIALLVVATLGYYYWLNSSKTSNDAPPFLRVPKQTLQGQLLSGDIICKIPGLYNFTDTEVSNYVKPSGATDADAKVLAEGVHLYHSNSELSISEILKSIVPTKGNKVMIGYYPSNANTDGNFAVYPADLQGVKKIPNPENYKIPANEGFAIFSCQNSKIYKILDEKTDGTGLPSNFSKADSSKPTHWILFSGWKGGSGAATLQKTIDSYNLSSIWVQSGDGFKFVQSNINAINLSGDYRMIWAEVNPSPIKQQTVDQQKAACEASPACAGKVCTPYYLGGYSCSVLPPVTVDNGAQTSCNKSCNNSCSPFASGTYACSKYPWASGFFLGVSGVTGYSCMSGGGCMLGLATGVHFTDYCDASSPNVNQTACTGYGGKIYNTVQQQPVTVPTGLIFNKATSTLSWNAVTDATGYMVGNSIDGVSQSVFNTGITSWFVYGYDPTKTYSFKVLTIGQNSATSSYSNTLTITGAPAGNGAEGTPEG